MSNSEPTRPEVEFPEGPASGELELVDVTIGSGAEANANSVVDVHYLGYDYDSGEEFDSSWSRNQSISFPLQQLVEGWRRGIPGMKVGGRRKLIVPPALGYGAVPGHPLSKSTLVFVIDLLDVK